MFIHPLPAMGALAAAEHHGFFSPLLAVLQSSDGLFFSPHPQCLPPKGAFPLSSFRLSLFSLLQSLSQGLLLLAA